MGAAFGRDFSGVRVHRSGPASIAASEVGAPAYTLDGNVAFAPGRYAPGTTWGQSVIAHELAHIAGGAPAGTMFRYGPDDFVPDAADRTQREIDSVASLGPSAPQGATGALDIRSDIAEHEGRASHTYRMAVSAAGENGSINTTTEMRLMADLFDPTATVITPTGPVFDPEFGRGQPQNVPAYPITLTYYRTITYTDTDGRSVDCRIHGSVQFSLETWRQHTEGITVNIDTLPAILGDHGVVEVDLSGSGPVQPYTSRFAAAGNSLDVQSMQAEWALQYGGILPINSTITPAFQRSGVTAGEQFTSMHDFLVAADTIELARRMQIELQRNEAEPGWLGAIGAALATFLTDVVGAIGDVWAALPAPIRGILKAVGKAGLILAAMAAVAGIIVVGAEALLGVTITFAAAMAVLGAIMLVGAFGLSFSSRMKEVIGTERYGLIPLVPVIAALDAIGFSAFVEAITDQSILTGLPLGPEGGPRSTEERWEAGTGGVIQMIMIALGLRALFKARVGAGTERTTGRTGRDADGSETTGPTQQRPPPRPPAQFDAHGNPIIDVAAADVAATTATFDAHGSGQGGTWSFRLFDSKSGAEFCWVEAEAVSPTAAPNGPHMTLTPHEATLPSGETANLRAQGFSWTRLMLERVILWYRGRFGRPPPDLDGLIAWDNLANFQKAFARIRAANPRLSRAEIGSLAAAEISFGRHRAGVGYGDLSAEMRSFGNVTVPDGNTQGGTVTLIDVPSYVVIKARPTTAGGP